MANQAIALQARAPQGNFLAPAIQQGAQFINMMSQQRAAERQAAAQQQQMDMQRASAAREAELQPDRVKKAAYEAFSSQQKAVLEFFDLAAEGVKQSRTPEDAVKIGQFLKSSFNSPELQGIVDQTLSSMPNDPALWPEWKKQTELQSLDSKDRLAEEFTTQNLGTSTRIVATPKFGGGVSRVVPGSEAAVTIKPTVVNVDGLGAVIVDPNTGRGYPVAAGQTGGYTPPGLVGGDRGGGAVAATPVAMARGAPRGPQIEQMVQQLSPGVIVSGRARTPERNAEVDGVPGSYHLSDNARDFQPAKGQTVAQLAARLQPLKAQGYDVLAEGDHVHVEPGPRMGRAAPTAPRATAPAGAPSQTLAQAATSAERARTVKQFKDITGFDFETGDDPVAALIKGSTSGGAEKIGADIMAFIPEEYGGGSTPGMKNIAALEVIGGDLMLALAPDGKLGAGISNEDRKVFERLKGKIEDPSVPADTRLAAWGQLKQKMARLAGVETPTTKGGNAPPTGGQTTVTTKKLPKTGEVRNGYRFLGGDPGKQTSWKKV